MISRIARVGRVARAGGGASVFDPAIVATAVARWTPGVSNFSDAGTTPAVADGTVQQVNDRIGAFTLSQATAGSRPTLRSVSGVWEWEFDGVDDFFALANGTILAAYPHTVAAKVRMLGNSLGALFSWGSLGGAEGGIASGWGSTGIDASGDNLAALFGGVRNIVGANDGAASGNLTLVYRYADDGATATSRFAATGYTATSDTGAEPAAPQNGAFIGAQRQTSRFLGNNCRIRDMVIYSTSIADADVATLLANW